MSKYAVVIGVNYVDDSPEVQLEGCCNDARMVVEMLYRKGFEEDNIKVLIDDDDSYERPNHINVKNALNWLCGGRSSDDTIFFHFSGHGTQEKSDGDDVEVDNLDEAIVLESLYLMSDDDLKQFFSQLPDGINATAVMDCCHSGTMLDGTEVVIEGEKDPDASGEPVAESAELLDALGGSRGADVSSNRSLNIGTLASALSGRLGTSVSPTGTGVGGAQAQLFGGAANQLALKYAMKLVMGRSQGSTGAAGGGVDGALMSAMTGMLGGASGSGSGGTGGAAGMLTSVLGGGGSSGGGGGSMGAAAGLVSSMMGGQQQTAPSGGGLMSMLGGGSQQPQQAPSAASGLMSMLGGGEQQQQAMPPPQQAAPSGAMGMLSSLMRDVQLPDDEDDEQAPRGFMTMVSHLMGQLGLSAGDGPLYNPNHPSMSGDKVVLVTGCQADETSSDVRPPGGSPHGALTKTLTDIVRGDPNISSYDLVSKVRLVLADGGFQQNPCLETTEERARDVFICES